MITDNSLSQIGLWHLIYMLSLYWLGRIDREQLNEMIAAGDDSILIVYDAAGRNKLLLPDHLSGRPRPLADILCNEKKLFALDLALLKPSCCEAPLGLLHVWFRPDRLGEARCAHAPRPALTTHPN